MATNDINVRARSIGNHGLATTQLTAFNGYSKHPQGNFYVPNSFNVQNKHRVIVRQAPLNSVNSASWLNSLQVDFKIEHAHVSTLTYAYVQVKITNSTGASVTLAPTPFWLDCSEIINSNGNVLSTVTGQEVYLSLAFLSRDEFEQMASYMCLSMAYATTGRAVADGASGIFYIPLFHLLSSAKLLLAGLHHKITIRLYTQSSSYILLSGSHPTVTEVAMILKGYSKPSSIKQSRRSLYNNKMPLKLPFINFIRHKDVQTLATSMQYTTILSTIKGTICGLFFTPRASGFSASTHGNYQAIANYDVQLASGESLTGHYIRLHEDSKLENAELFNNVFGNNKDWYFVSFSSDPSGDYSSGANSGYQFFVGTEKLVWTTNSTITPGTFQLDVIALSVEHLHIMDGYIKAQK
jgi:hypothetical protein